MRIVSKISLWLVLTAFLCSSVALADVDKDKDKKKSQSSSTAFKSRPDVGNCSLGAANKDLDGNNVRARLFNNGGLFWRGSGNVYTVPKNGEANAVFASGIWIGGLDDSGELRFVGTAYGPWELWPGPLDENGNPPNPNDCSAFDRIYKVTKEDLDTYELQGTASADILDWPWDLGAPVVDGDGNPNNYNLEGGDRPELIGEQTLWWVMNDVGNVKEWSKTAPIGLEVQVTAFAFRSADALNNTTFYKYKLIHKGDQALNDTWFGLWSDPDLGNAADDYVGSDTTLGLGIVYNGTDIDQGVDGYGATPPALAYDFFQGPLVPAPGETYVDPDGTEHPDQTRLPMQRFMYYNNDASVIGNPTGDSDDPYNYLRGIWRDGSRITLGGNGYGGTVPVDYMFPGNPVTRDFWSEENTDGRGSRNTPADRRFLMSTGPFTLQPGDVQEIVYGIVWSRSVNRLASVAQLKRDDILAQGAFNANFNIPPPPDAPRVSVDVMDETVILEWGYRPTSNNYLNKFDAPSAFLFDTDPEDGNTTYTLEGYKIYQFDSAFDGEGRVIATYDAVNNVTTIVDEDLDLATGAVISKVVAQGRDSGIQNFHIVDNLTNYQEYFFGVQAYAYNPNSLPKIYASPITRVTVIPQKVDARDGGTSFQADPELNIESVRTTGIGDSFGVFARVVRPSAITGNDYNVRVYSLLPEFGVDLMLDPDHPEDITRALVVGADTLFGAQALTYDVVNASTGEVAVSGRTFFTTNQKLLPFGADLFNVDGLSFGIDTAPPNFKNFLVTANAAGPIDPPTGGAADFQGFPVPERPGASQQVGEGVWMFNTGATSAGVSYEAFVGRSVRNGWDPVVPFDFEVRFTERCYNAWRASVDAGDPFATPADGCYAYDRFSLITDAGDTPQLVPYELWNIGIDTPDDPSDDFRLVPAVIDWEGDGYNLQCFDTPASGANNDPEMDWTYWYNPIDQSPGEGGYNAWVADLLSGTTPYTHANEILARTIFFNWNGGEVDGCTLDNKTTHFDQDMPEAGTIFRLITTKPLADGDVFAISTQDAVPVRGDQAAALEAVEKIGIVPNPYKGVSAYEVDVTNDKARFTNLPSRATIRVFTLGGTLIRTIEKNSSSASLEWNLRTEEDLPMASGMYIIHVEAKDASGNVYGEKVIKFGFIKKRIQLDLI